jgi:soluble lytic murein transglycosylase-like protein
MAVDLPPPFPPVVMQCATYAAQEYQLPRILLLSIIKTESGGKVSAMNRNTNGTVDTGIMQINSKWVQHLEYKFGIKNATYHVKNDVCYNIRVGAWILKKELASSKPIPFWQKVANYHSKIARYNQRYQKLLISNMQWLMQNTKWWA